MAQFTLPGSNGAAPLQQEGLVWPIAQPRGFPITMSHVRLYLPPTYNDTASISGISVKAVLGSDKQWREPQHRLLHQMNELTIPDGLWKQIYFDTEKQRVTVEIFAAPIRPQDTFAIQVGWAPKEHL